jgi:MoaA/NifB/PqqE/SkfB family radical SAM enzyme
MHGMQNEYFKKYMMISYETFRKIIDEIGPYLFKVIMYHRGEAFFNKNIYDMLEYLKRYNIHSSISSNFNFRFKTEDFKNIVHSHLTHLILSVDGITQDVYTKYRRGGNLELVKHNIRELANMKKAYKSNKPVMELQFIIFKHNVHQLKKLDSFAKELGIDRISITKDVTLDGGFYAGCNCKEKITEEYIQKEIAKRTNFRPLCEWPWYAAVVKWNGEIVPCCHYDWGNETLGFGNIVHDYFWNIWNGQRYIKLRQFLSRPKRSSRIDPFCSGCLKLIGKRPVI